MDNIAEKNTRKYDKWSDEERQLLMRLADEDKATKPTISWITISKNFANKTPRQCYDQYLFQQKHRAKSPTYSVQELFQEIMKIKWE